MIDLQSWKAVPTQSRALGTLRILLGATLAFAAACTSVSNSNAAPAAVARPVEVPKTTAQTMSSTVTGENYRIWVSQPTAPPPPQGYPLVVLLDANHFFGTVVDMTRLMEFGKEVPPMVIVGVSYPFDDMSTILPKRAKDLTPTVWQPPERMRGLGPDSGGAQRFRQFLTTQLIPQVRRDYQIDQTREVLAAVSLGGLFAVDTLLSAPEAFDGYVVVSPSLWWDDGVLLKRERGLSQEARAKVSGRLFLSVGGDEEQGAYADALMVTNVRRLGSQITNSRYPNLVANTRIFPGETHLSTPAVALIQGLRFVLGPQDRRAQ